MVVLQGVIHEACPDFWERYKFLTKSLIDRCLGGKRSKSSIWKPLFQSIKLRAEKLGLTTNLKVLQAFFKSFCKRNNVEILITCLEKLAHQRVPRESDDQVFRL